MHIGSIMDYGSEVWGSHMGPDIERVHLSILKHVLGVRRTTNNTMNSIGIYFMLRGKLSKLNTG